MRILGIASNVHLSTAVLVEDGRVVAGAAEERFDRVKFSREFPDDSLRFCLSEAGIKLSDVDCVAVSANPVLELAKRSRRHVGSVRYYPEILYAIPTNLGTFGELRGHVAMQHIGPQLDLEVCYVTHHLAHAANAFLWSPFPRAAILTVDGRGEETSMLFGVGVDDRIEILREVAYPDSLGLFYGAITEYLGFRIDRDEWKVMGLSGYGDSNGEIYAALRELVELKSDGTTAIDLNYFRYFLQPYDGAVGPKFVERFGAPRKAGEELLAQHHDVAAAAQRIVEEALAHMLGALQRETGEHRVALGGGTFMNSVFNGKLPRVTPFTETFVSSCPDDSGTAVGAALYVHSMVKHQGRPEAQTHNYYGPQYDDRSVMDELEAYKLPARQVEDIERFTAQQLVAGKLVGWFQGRMELGQRALGSRSILADARDLSNRDRINRAVKFREAFRPFAPALLQEDFSLYFDEPALTSVPFMERTLPVRREQRERIPAVVHVDGTARPQTVTAESNPRFYRLLRCYKELTGIGVVLNTSFNLNDEPIVCSPRDAIRTFFSSGLDILVIGTHVVEK